MRQGHGVVPVRVVLADDHAAVRRGMIKLLEREQDIEVVGEAADGREAVECARRLRPDVILMDASMPGMSGVDATRVVVRECPGVRIVGLSMHAMDGTREAMLEAGAEAYLTKDMPPADILAAIRRRGAGTPGATHSGGAPIPGHE